MGFRDVYVCPVSCIINANPKKQDFRGALDTSPHHLDRTAARPRIDSSEPKCSSSPGARNGGGRLACPLDGDGGHVWVGAWEEACGACDGKRWVLRSAAGLAD